MAYFEEARKVTTGEGYHFEVYPVNQPFNRSHRFWQVRIDLKTGTLELPSTNGYGWEGEQDAKMSLDHINAKYPPGKLWVRSSRDLDHAKKLAVEHRQEALRLLALQGYILPGSRRD